MTAAVFFLPGTALDSHGPFTRREPPTMSPETTLDARGLTCPLPILRAKKALKTLDDGAVLTVLATDPSSVRDFATFCRQTGNELLETAEETDGVFRYRIRKVV
jgi:tRNA 2-thiouridine synthesizing protein A